MGSRIIAAIVVIASVAALLWVTLGGADNQAATNPVSTVDAASAPSNGGASTQPSPDTEPIEPATAASDSDSKSSETQSGTTSQVLVTPPSPPEGLENQGPRMDLVNIDGWLNTDATSIDDFNGQVLLVEMWTFGCFNCKARIPFNQQYYEEFGDENFEILGVHAPEFSFEADVDNIKTALVDLGVSWPVALDTEKLNFRAWQEGRRNFWPRTYVIDQNGEIRYDHIGEGRYEELREVIRYLIENPPAPKITP